MHIPLGIHKYIADTLRVSYAYITLHYGLRKVFFSHIFLLALTKAEREEEKKCRNLPHKEKSMLLPYGIHWKINTVRDQNLNAIDAWRVQPS